MSRKKNLQLKWGSILSYAQMGLNVLIGLAVTPVILRLLGQSEYGLYSTVSSTIAMLTILNLGFSAGYIRYYARYKASGEEEKISSLNGLFIILFSIIGLIALVCGFFMTANLTVFFKDGLSQAEYYKATIMMTLLSIRMAISFPLGVFSSIIVAHERFVFVKICGMINTVFSPLITLVVLYLGLGSIGMVVVSVVLGTVTDCIYGYYVYIRLKQHFTFHGFEPGIVRELFSYTFFIAINMIVDQINWNIDKLLLARFKGTSAVAIYSIGYSLYNYYMAFSTSISSVFTPRIHRIVNETVMDSIEQNNKLTDLFVKVGRIQTLILGLVATGLIFMGKIFIVKIWTNEGYEESYYVMLLLTLPASIALIQNLGIEIQRAENRHKFRSIAYFIMAIVNFILSISLCPKYGAIGCAIGTAISLILANGIIINIYYHKKCNIDVIRFWKEIASMLPGFLIPSFLGTIIMVYVNIEKVSSFVLYVCIYTITYSISVWFFSMNADEKELFAQLIKRLKREK